MTKSRPFYANEGPRIRRDRSAMMTKLKGKMQGPARALEREEQDAKKRALVERMRKPKA